MNLMNERLNNRSMNLQLRPIQLYNNLCVNFSTCQSNTGTVYLSNAGSGLPDKWYILNFMDEHFSENINTFTQKYFQTFT